MKLRDRFKEVLVDPTWEQIVERDPLIAFSFFLAGRVHVLFDVAGEIIENLDQGFLEAPVNGDRIARAESLMWLWILGTYEVVRTMCQAKDCFSERALDQLMQFKKTLSSVRMPAAKMEKAGRKVPVSSNRSASGWDVAGKDLFINDPESIDVRARSLLQEFDRVFSSITKDDVLGPHEASYPG